jgi:adenylate cyclase
LREIRIPSTVEGIIAARIDRQPAEDKALLQMLAAIGIEFPLSLVRQVLRFRAENTGSRAISATAFAEDSVAEGSTLEARLGRLQLGELIYERPTFGDVEYTFKHALTHDVAYNSLLIERRRILHGQIGQAIESLFSDRLDDHISDLARHYVRSGNTPMAVEYLTRAAQLALSHSAYKEADEQVCTAMALVKLLPEGEVRDHRELALQLMACETLGLLKGYAAAEVEVSAKRARILAQSLGDAQSAFRANKKLVLYYSVGENSLLARQTADDLIAQAEESGDPSSRVQAHAFVGYNLTTTGNFGDARKHLETSIAAYNSTSDHSDPEMRHDVCVAHVVLGSALNAAGFPDRGLGMSRRGLELAREIGHKHTIALTLGYQALLHQSRGDIDETLNATEELASLTRAHEFGHWGEWAVLLGGWATARKGQVANDVGLTKRGLEMLLTPAEGDRRWSATLSVAEVAQRAGDPRAGLAALEALGDLKGRTDQRPDLLFRARHERGDLLALSVTDAEMQEAEELFRGCIESARRGGAKLLELRSTTSLARLLAKRGKRNEARVMLAEIYNWFTEGFDTAALKDAKALLDELNQ